MRVILAAGGVVRLDGRVAVIYRSCYDDWTLPKGKLERGERFEQAAVREVLEETGCRAKIRDLIGTVDYRVARGPKVVLYYDMEVVAQQTFEASKEVQALEWLDAEDALQRLTYALERDVLRRWAAAGQG